MDKEAVRQLAARRRECLLSVDSELGNFTKDPEPYL